MRDHSPPKRRTQVIETTIRLLPLAEMVVEEIAEVQNNTPAALIAVRVLVRAVTLICTLKRTG